MFSFFLNFFKNVADLIPSQQNADNQRHQEYHELHTRDEKIAIELRNAIRNPNTVSLFDNYARKILIGPAAQYHAKMAKSERHEGLNSSKAIERLVELIKNYPANLILAQLKHDTFLTAETKKQLFQILDRRHLNLPKPAEFNLAANTYFSELRVHAEQNQPINRPR